MFECYLVGFNYFIFYVVLKERGKIDWFVIIDFNIDVLFRNNFINI